MAPSVRRRRGIYRAIVVVVVVSLLQSGCAFFRKGPTPEQRAAFGTIGVASASYAPAFEYDIPAKGRPAGAAKGAAIAFFGILGGGMQGGAGAGPGIGFYLVLVTALATAAAPVGAIVGAAKAMPGEEAELSEKLAMEILERTGTQEALRDEILEEGSWETDRGFLPVDGTGPASLDNDATYGFLAGSGIDTVLEVAMKRIALETDKWGSDPPLKLAMTARCRLVRVADNAVIDDHVYLARSKSAKLSEWLADDAAMFEAEYEQGYRSLADGVISRLFRSAAGSAPDARRTSAPRDNHAAKKRPAGADAPAGRFRVQ